jgi:hypothetical protein
LSGSPTFEEELRLVHEYIKAVARYWWAIVTGLVLTLLDGVERLFGFWYLPPRWAKLSTGIAGLVLAQYLAYRDLARRVADSEDEFKEQARRVLRNAELQWALVDKPDARVTPEMICKQVDGLRSALERLYSECPDSTNSQPMRDAIDKLHATKAHRVGNLIGSQQDLDKVFELMRYALADVRGMLGSG